MSNTSLNIKIVSMLVSQKRKAPSALMRHIVGRSAMLQRWHIFLVASLVFAGAQCSVLVPKCCEFDEGLVRENNTLFCSGKGLNLRLVVQGRPVLKRGSNASEECVETLDSNVLLFNYHYHNDTISGTTTKVPTFPKCCPPGGFYNPAGRSCVFTPNRSNPYDEPFLEIGLAHCQVVSDHSFQSQSDFRLENASLVLPDGEESFPKGQFCVDQQVGRGFIVRLCRGMNVCEKVRCIRKCCPDGKSFVNGSHCEDTFVHGLEFGFVRSFVGDVRGDFAIVHGYPGRVFLEPDISKFSLDEKGYFHNAKSHEIYPPQPNQPYCIEHATKNQKTLHHRYFGHLKHANPPLSMKFLLNRGAMAVSSIFLVVTIIFYIFTRETRKVFGKTLVSFCVALLVLYSLLVYVTFTPNLHHKRNKTACKTIGFAIIYLGFSCFLWLQIMCFDIYWTFGSSKNFTTYSERRRKDLKRFLLYSSHGWITSLLFTLLLVLFHFVNVLPKSIEIKMGVTRCAIEKGHNNYAEIMFSSLPLTVIQVVNCVLFVKTITYCLKVKGDIKKMNQTAQNIKKRKKFFAKRARLILVVKLSLTMGIFYLFEVVSSFFDFSSYKVTEIVEIIWDFINCLQGLYIFLIFVCKKKNCIKCTNLSPMEKIRKISLTSTRTTGLSSVTRKISNVRGTAMKMETIET